MIEKEKIIKFYCKHLGFKIVMKYTCQAIYFEKNAFQVIVLMENIVVYIYIYSRNKRALYDDCKVRF